MNDIQKIELRKIIVVSIISVGIIVAFSIPLGIIPALGGLLFPGNGLWKLNVELGESQIIVSNELESDVTVYRDEWGIPHIYGSGEGDLMFALGYVHAQDRLFQMDLARRLTRGRLSEILGSEALEVDKFNLNMLKEYWANETINVLKNSEDEELQNIYSLLLMYCAGVNKYINENTQSLSIEFLILGYTPEEWTPLDSMCFAKYMSEMLTWTYSDVYSFLLNDKLGSANYSELFGLPLDYQIPICPNYGEFFDISAPSSQLDASSSFEDTNFPEVSFADSRLNELFSEFINSIESIPQEQQRIQNLQEQNIGSNNWVVNGTKTTSGYPILCNDMHLGHSLPGIWYEAHLIDTSSDFNIYGFYLAGVPLALVGHNNYVGWGFTNVAYDVIDWYYYTSVDENHYEYKGIKTEYDVIDYSIPVKGEDSVDFSVKSTVHGPVFTSLFTEDFMDNALDQYDIFYDSVIACKWTAQNITWELLALYGYSHAQNRTEFSAASENFACPAQNHVYADIHGDIGIRPTGKVPIRDDTTFGIPAWHTGNGTMPYNGSKGEGEWIGYVDFDDLPHSENPDQCYLTSANQIVAGPDYLVNFSLQHPLGIARGYRARRINTLLAQGSDFTIDDMKEIQLDVYSTYAGNVTPYLLVAIEDIDTLKSQQQVAYDVLDDWDYVMDKEGAAPCIFSLWREILLNITFSDDCNAFGIDALPPNSVLEKLIKEDQNSIWFDDISTPEIENCNDSMIIAFNLTLSALHEFFNDINPEDWVWGDMHKVQFTHISGIESLGDEIYPVNGSGYTITPSWGSNYRNSEVKTSYAGGGASERLIIDFSDLNKTLSVIPSGERGVPGSDNYMDQLELYMDGEYHPQYFSADTLEEFRSEWIKSTISFKSGGN